MITITAATAFDFVRRIDLVTTQDGAEYELCEDESGRYFLTTDAFDAEVEYDEGDPEGRRNAYAEWASDYAPPWKHQDELERIRTERNRSAAREVRDLVEEYADENWDSARVRYLTGRDIERIADQAFVRVSFVERIAAEDSVPCRAVEAATLFADSYTEGQTVTAPDGSRWTLAEPCDGAGLGESFWVSAGAFDLEVEPGEYALADWSRSNMPSGEVAAYLELPDTGDFDRAIDAAIDAAAAMWVEQGGQHALVDLDLDVIAKSFGVHPGLVLDRAKALGVPVLA